MNVQKDMSELPRVTHTNSGQHTNLGKGLLRVRKHDNRSVKEIDENVVSVGNQSGKIVGRNQSPVRRSEFSGDKRFIESEERHQDKNAASSLRQPTLILWKSQTVRLGGLEAS
jgi:hypothetical protein